MEHRGPKTEIQRAVRAIASGFNTLKADNPGGRYVTTFDISLALPLANKTESEIASFIEAASRIVNAFPEGSQMAIDFKIATYSDFATKLLEKVKVNYEESQKLEGQKPQLVTPGQVPAQG